MTVDDLIHLLAAQDPHAIVAFHDCQEHGAVRELQSNEIKPVALYRLHPDRAPRLDNSPAPGGHKLQAILLGTR
jgi:hypothetical protein